jgi:hypothetical protein
MKEMRKRMRGRKKAAICAIALLLVVTTVCRRIPATTTSELNAAEYDVFSAYITGKIAGRKAMEPVEAAGNVKIVVLNVTQSDEYGRNIRLDANGQPTPWAEAAKSLLKKVPLLEPATTDAFRKANAQQASLRRSFDHGIDYELVDSAQLDSIFKSGDWPAYYKQFPGSQGILALSRVGFSADGTQSLFYVTNRCGGLCGAGFYVVMEKRDGGWAIVKEIETWVS